MWKYINHSQTHECGVEIGTEAAQFLSWEYLFPVCGTVSLQCRETRVGWPLLTVETELNGDSKSTNERGPLPWLVCGAVLPVQEILFCLGSLVSTVENIFFSPYTISTIAQQAGQAAVRCRLSPLYVSLAPATVSPANMGRNDYLLSNPSPFLLSHSLW